MGLARQPQRLAGRLAHLEVRVGDTAEDIVVVLERKVDIVAVRHQELWPDGCSARRSTT